MFKKINWVAWLILIIYGIMDFTNLTFQDVVVAVFLSILIIIIQLLQSRYLKKSSSKVNLINNEGALNVGIHYDYKSTRGDKAMKKSKENTY